MLKPKADEVLAKDSRRDWPMTDEANNRARKPEKPEPRRPGGKTKRGASKRSPTKKAMKKSAKKAKTGTFF